MKTTNKKIKMIVEKTDTGFSAFSEDYPIYTTGRTIPELIDNALEAANLYFEEENVQKAHTNIIKVERIIEEFQATLDHKYPVAKDFDEVYNYLMIRLREANMKKDKEILEEVLKHLRTMRDTWKEVMRVAHSK